MLMYSSVVSVNFPTTVTTISTNCFNQAKSLTTINGNSEVIDLSFVTEAIGQGGFYQCGSLACEIIVNAKTIGKECFKQTSNVTKFTFGPNVQTIVSGLSFRYDESLEEVVFLSMVAPSIDPNCFGNTSNFTLYFPVGATGYDAAGYTTGKPRAAVGGVINDMETDGTNTTVTFTPCDLSAYETKKVLIALYNESDVMVGVKTVTVANEDANTNQTVTFENASDATTAMMFTWVDLTGAKPISSAYEYVAAAE